ncbi:MAG: hsp70 family protein, partial [Proteobacteria bacterium]|nr:hsp70 family protein [Pseudomonadota bacterium]
FGASVTLLEEPLAAFYSWLILHEMDWQQYIREDDLILVCDVGGGTSDFSLITVTATQGSPRFERLAVGDHLILGGDNIDLALAKVVEAKFRSKTHLTPDKWKTLCHRCREAKEKILENGERSVRITLKGQGRALIAGTLAADLTRGEVETVLQERFFPDVDMAELNDMDTGKEIADFGLPFERESSVTKHIVRFLEKHRTGVKEALGKESPMPDFILFNGGTLKPILVQSRIKEAIQRWFKAADPQKPRILENASPELAVGVGASYYGLVKLGVGVRVGSGSPRSYYLGVTVESGNDAKAVCLVERGLDEGSVIDLSEMAFDVRANEPVSFDVYSSSFRSGDRAGNIISIDDSLTSMTPIQTIVRFGKNGEKKTIPVTMGAEYTEMGTLAMYCQSSVSEHRWKLQFQLRDLGAAVESAETEVYDDRLIERVSDRVEQAFSSQSQVDLDLNGLVKQIEDMVEQRKANWPLSFLRRLADRLLAIEASRLFSAEHESRWLNLLGFCMRPGFGDAFDGERTRQFWKVYLSGLQFNKAQQNRLEWWICLRRIAGGLNAGQQRQVYQDIAAFLTKPKTNKGSFSPQEQIELWMAAGNMERLLVKDKVVLAKALLPQLKPGKKQERLFWTLGRLGARELLYGSIDRVIPPAEVSRWAHRLMKQKWNKEDPAQSLVSEIARKTGDRNRDMDSDTIAQIIQWLENTGADAALIKRVVEKIQMALNEKNIQFGERLPAGLVLK